LDAYSREWERIQGLRDEVIAEFEASLRPALGEGGEEGVEEEDELEENIVVRDAPKDCGEWKSETMQDTHREVVSFTVQNSRPKMQLMIMRPRGLFGKSFKFTDSGENINGARPQKDPNYSLLRKELELGIQAVKEMRTVACQTTWYRLVNRSTQYSPNDFLPKQTDAGYGKVDELTAFLSLVSVGVEEALQTNETLDIFQDEFATLGEADAGATSDANSGIKDLRTFQDVNLTKGKRIECVEWVPGSTDMLACSCCESLSFTERLENTGKATDSTILIWSFQDPLAPHAILKSPWEVPVFKFYPSDEKFLVAGLSSGQVAVWKLSGADLGHAVREKGTGAQEEERSSATPMVRHKQISIIDESHRKPVMAIEWLPPTIEIEKRGRGASEKHPKDGPVRYFVTIAGDGQVLLWNFQESLDSINDADFLWQPIHSGNRRVQLQRQDSGTEMGCCHLLYCHDTFDEKGIKQLTQFYASTEEGELILGDWAARAEEDRKAEYVKKIFPISKTFRPMLSLERSPFFPEIILGVTDWAFFLWKSGVKEHLFQSSYTSTYFTRGVWSPTRPSVIFLGLNNGGIDIWDFSDQSHKAALSDAGASAPIASMVFRKPGDRDAIGEQLLAVGDSNGTLHVLSVPKNLVRQAGKEKDTMARFLEREEGRVKYFEERRHALADLKEKMEREEQMAVDKEAAEKEKPSADQEAVDNAAEAMYQKLELEVLEQLKG
jgi:WD40 repeat protein